MSHFNRPRENGGTANPDSVSLLLNGLIGTERAIGVLVQVVPARRSRGGPGRTNEISARCLKLAGVPPSPV
jgi:hypothetical protein